MAATAESKTIGAGTADTGTVDGGTAAQPVARARRLWEIDFLRGTAVITMIVFHFAWDLTFLGVASIDPTRQTSFWYLLQRYTAVTFIVLAGLSATLANAGLQRKGVSTGGRFWHFVKRGAWVFFWGLVISGVLWAAGRSLGARLNIDFGVLHLIGASTVLAFPFLRFKWLNVVVWAVLFVAGGYLLRADAPHLWLVWLGWHPQGYTALDYFPLIPWFGVFLLGVAAGNWLYPQGTAIFTITDRSQAGPVRALRFLGRHSLPIYLLHQLVLIPIAYGVAWLIASRLM